MSPDAVASAGVEGVGLGRCRALLQQLDDALADLAADEIPEVVGELARLDAVLRLRLASPAPPEGPAPADRLLTPEEVAERLKQKVSWVYAHRNDLPAVNIGGRSLRFSERRLEAYLRRRGLP
jgi:excisionase family DNA binding protein